MIFFTETGGIFEYEDILAYAIYIKKRNKGDLNSDELINYCENPIWKEIMKTLLNSKNQNK